MQGERDPATENPPLLISRPHGRAALPCREPIYPADADVGRCGIRHEGEVDWNVGSHPINEGLSHVTAKHRLPPGQARARADPHAHRSSESLGPTRQPARMLEQDVVEV